MDSLVDVDWLAGALAEPDLVVLDCRVAMAATGPVAARDAYEAGHVPGAVFADLITDLSDTDSPLGFALPTAEAFCAAMGRLGVGDDSRVVLYDATTEMPGFRFSSIWAARVWWMLRWVGFDRAALLDGGLGAWERAGYELAAGRETRPPRALTPDVRRELVADRDEVRAASATGDVTLVDSLPADHFAGRTRMYARPGHITGAVNVPVFDLFDPEGSYLPDDRLASRHAGLPNRRTITYCGGGIAASASAFVLTRLGYGDVAVYTASLQEWAADESNPMSTTQDPAGE